MKEDIKLGYKKFESTAYKYAQNPQKTDKLLKKTMKKAARNRGTLKDIWKNLQLLMDLMKSWSKGEYKDVSKKSIVFIIASILYFISPIDLVPDFLIGIGIVDDAAVLGYAIKQISGELEKYESWKEKRHKEV
ncbi:YkvA family protein [Bacillus sp. S/N-304-OC-R1]|uniref:YkvA family protein n=1 Tax=Bacillus sp. S/N-304-OC-R1 TaxID=2758034 RepID=UPI001C8E1CF5|nr:YkvA family protein [Bacillus sp. S/N-304-OC-R1]MBY0120958.1 DUF1232 domain-containing protein [Bacillus sp. S/N-304-OC-R1]